MARQNKRSMIDARWQELQPGWGPKDHGAEQKMLYEALEDGESLEALVGCVWGPNNVFRADAGRFDRMKRYDGIAVATERRVVLLKKKGMNDLITEMPLHSIESVDVDGEGEVTLTGRSYSHWAGHGSPNAFKIRDVQDGYARNFSDRVREIQAAPPQPVAPARSSPSSSPSPGASAPFTRSSAVSHAGMSKEERIEAQWRERSTMWGRNNPSVPERLIAGLFSSFSGENVTAYPGELRMLQEVLEDDENIEYWMGGRWGDATEFNTMGDAIIHAIAGVRTLELGVHNGVVAATDRRILMLNSGMVLKDVVEVPYEGLQVDYNEGMISSGLKFSGSTTEDYAFYLDHSGKKNIRSRARPLFECVLRRARGAANPAGA